MGLITTIHKTSERYEDMFVDSTWQSPFVAMNIEYKDSVYSIVPREGQAAVLNITEVRYKTGLVSKLDVSQAKSVYYSTAAWVWQLWVTTLSSCCSSRSPM